MTSAWHYVVIIKFRWNLSIQNFIALSSIFSSTLQPNIHLWFIHFGKMFKRSIYVTFTVMSTILIKRMSLSSASIILAMLFSCEIEWIVCLGRGIVSNVVEPSSPLQYINECTILSRQLYLCVQHNVRFLNGNTDTFVTQAKNEHRYGVSHTTNMKNIFSIFLM